MPAIQAPGDPHLAPVPVMRKIGAHSMAVWARQVVNRVLLLVNNCPSNSNFEVGLHYAVGRFLLSAEAEILIALPGSF